MDKGSAQTEDIQGSTGKILDDSLSAKNTYSYTDFGEVEVSTSETNGNTTSLVENEICYTGAIYDESTGLHYLNARYYDPENGRFISQDTYRGDKNEISQWHLYAYCANNPINYTDPSGHWVTSIGLKVEAAMIIGLYGVLALNFDKDRASLTMTEGIKFITNIGASASVILSYSKKGSTKTIPTTGSLSCGSSYSIGSLISTSASVSVSKGGTITSSASVSVGKWLIPFASAEIEYGKTKEKDYWTLEKLPTVLKSHKIAGLSFSTKNIPLTKDLELRKVEYKSMFITLVKLR